MDKLPSVGPVQPSSLIFVLVVAIWAAYLLQYWVKRRDHLATVRSVDRFSTAMRVLDDHRMRRETVEATPRSYSVAPTRSARPEVTVKHAEAPRRTSVVEPVAGAPRKVRGLTLVSLVALLPVVLLVTAFGPLPWWVTVAWLVGIAGAFAWLRQAVQAERAAAARARAQERRAPRAAEPTQASRREASPAPRRRAPVAAAPFDIAEEAPAPEVPADETSAPAQEPEPGTWQPTPVPRPMYTMKAKAERPAPAQVPVAPATPSVPVASDDTPQVIDVEDEELPAIAGWG